MDLKDYFGILWRRKWIVVASIVAALAIAIAGTAAIRPAYQATATVRVAASATGLLNYTVLTYSEHLINTAAQIVSSQPMLDQVMSRLKLTEKPVITAALVPGTELIKITVEYSNPRTAAEIANALADSLIAESSQVYTGGNVSSQDVLAQQLADYKTELDLARKEYNSLIGLTPAAPEKAAVALDLLQLKERNYETLLLQYNDVVLQQQIRSSMMTVVDPAVPPTSPIRPQAAYNYILGLAIGLLVGVVVAFAAESFDSTMYTAKEVETAAALPILARIPKAPANKVRMAANDQSALGESFRNLALNVMLADHEKSGHVLLVLGAEAQQGKSTVAANLATALGEYGKNTVVIDCDMRRPKLHELFRLPNESGLSNILEGGADPKAELRQAGECVSIITSGAKPLNPTQLLSSPTMANLINDLRKQFDFVLLDTPALLAVSDASTIAQNVKLAENVDMFVLVVRQGRSEREPVRAAGKLIEKLPHEFAGVVLNDAAAVRGNDYYRS